MGKQKPISFGCRKCGWVGPDLWSLLSHDCSWRAQPEQEIPEPAPAPPPIAFLIPSAPLPPPAPEPDFHPRAALLETYRSRCMLLDDLGMPLEPGDAPGAAGEPCREPVGLFADHIAIPTADGDQMIMVPAARVIDTSTTAGACQQPPARKLQGAAAAWRAKQPPAETIRKPARSLLYCPGCGIALPLHRLERCENCGRLQ